MNAPLPDLAGAADFGQAARRVLDYLNAELPLALWSITRVDGSRQTHLFLDEGNGYGVRQGGTSVWEASFCIRMVSGAGPAVAPDVQAVPAYAAAEVNQEAVVGAYAGAVLRDADGSLFGAICGLDPHVRTDDSALTGAGPVLALLGQLLSMSLALERARAVARRELEASRLVADTDPLTGLANRRAWDRVLQDEASALRRLGDPAVVVVLDLDRLKELNDSDGHAAGDDHLRRAATAIRSAVAPQDVVARLGGDEFAVLLRCCTETAVESVVARIDARLAGVGVAASLGWAVVTVLGGLPTALAEADAAMYAAKRANR